MDNSKPVTQALEARLCRRQERKVERSGSREQQGKDKDVPEDRSAGREQCIGGGGRWVNFV